MKLSKNQQSIRQSVKKVNASQAQQDTQNPEDMAVRFPHIPSALLSPTGIVGEISKYINDTAYRKQPVFAVSAALSLVGVVLGRLVAGDTGVRTNLYLVNVGVTGCGKDHARSVTKRILFDAGLGDLLGGEDISSGQALMTRLGHKPSTLSLIDEMGDFLLSMLNGEKNGGHKAEIATAMMKLATSAQDIMIGKEYANMSPDDRLDIEYPCYGINGTTTPVSLYPALTGKKVGDGFLNRFIFCVSDEYIPAISSDGGQNAPIPHSIKSWIKNVIDVAGDLPDPANPFTVPRSPEAKQIIDDFGEKAREIMNGDHFRFSSALYNRAREHALRIALVLACGDSDDISKAEISGVHAKWAVDFVELWIKEMVKVVEEHVADSDYERQRNAALKVIKNSGAKGSTQSDLTRKSRVLRPLSKKERQDILSDLESLGEITLQTMKFANNRTRTSWVTTG